MNQALLRSMAEERILDADALRAAGRWAYAYYVVGYAVECGLKSCVLARMIYTGGVFTDKKAVEKYLIHDFANLVRLAGLTQELDPERAANTLFANNWGMTSLWKETSRYEPKTQLEAEDLYSAITDQANGVMQWIRNYW